MRAYIVRGLEADEARVAIIYTTPEEINRKVDALRWSRVQFDVIADHVTVCL